MSSCCSRDALPKLFHFSNDTEILHKYKSAQRKKVCSLFYKGKNDVSFLFN